MTPFLKWPGGKRWLVANYGSLLPTEYNVYIEPFLGGGSVYFHLQPERAILGDLNEELITTYRAVRDDWAVVEALLSQHQALHSKRHYYEVRRSKAADSCEAAARFIYLNRTCFNGIYRVNRHGRFNVPKGTKNTVVLDTDDLRSTASLLKTAKLTRADFEELIDLAVQDDFVFADPPYTVTHSSNGFIKYNEKLFSWADQIRLADSVARALARGARIVVTNANHPAVGKLYKERCFCVRAVSRFSSVSGDPEGRDQFEELIAVDPLTQACTGKGDHHGSIE
jgi:DNA adenine methylase